MSIISPFGPREERGMSGGAGFLSRVEGFRIGGGLVVIEWREMREREGCEGDVVVGSTGGGAEVRAVKWNGGRGLGAC